MAMTKALAAMCVLSAPLQARAYELFERSAVHGLVAVEEISVAVEADDAPRLHREDWRAGVAAERRTVVEDGARAAARDLARRGALDAERPAEERVDEERVSLRVVEGVAHGDHGVALFDRRCLDFERPARVREGLLVDGQECNVQLLVDGEHARDVRGLVLVGDARLELEAHDGL